MKRSILAVAVLLQGCMITTEANLAGCDLEAMKVYQNDILAQRHYAVSCMRARGFVVDAKAIEHAQAVSIALDPDGAWLMQPQYWKRNFLR